jgi:hypothetical protein
LLPTGAARFTELQKHHTFGRPNMSQNTALAWRKSSYSGGGSENCVEVASTPAGIAVRDSKKPTAQYLQFTPQEWLSFLSALRTAGGEHLSSD